MAAGLALAVVGVPAPAGAATQFTLTGHGWGHGIGLSQYGALGYAQHGWKYPAILTHYFTGTHLAPAATTFNERVLLLDGVAHVDLTFSSPANVGAKGAATEAVPAGKYRIQLGTTAGRLQLVNRGTGRLVRKGLVPPVVATPLATSLQLNQPAGMWDADHHWRGSLHIHKSGNRLMLVDWIPIEKYVAAVVPNEVSASWPTPAVRKQAVAVRSYAYATRNPGRVFDTTLSDQTYGPIEREAALGTAAAVGTNRNVVWFGSTIATTFDLSSSGGRTLSEAASGAPPAPARISEAGRRPVRRRRRRQPQPHLGAQGVLGSRSGPRLRVPAARCGQSTRPGMPPRSVSRSWCCTQPPPIAPGRDLQQMPGWGFAPTTSASSRLRSTPTPSRFVRAAA